MKKNIIANYIGKIWNFGSVYIFIRFYVEILGIESYGLINFYNVLFSIVFFLDAGLSATLNREFSRTNDNKYLRNLLVTTERIFICLTIFISIVIFFTSELIATKWLGIENLSLNEVVNSIKIMGVSIALQLAMTLYNSGLIGLEKQVLVNTVQVIGSVFRSAFVLIPLYFYPSLFVFFSWQLLINLGVLLICRYYLWKNIPHNNAPRFNLNILSSLKYYALGMLLMSIIGALNTQIDKLIVSKILVLSQYGYYSLCSVLSQAPTLSIIPLFIAILPRWTKNVEQKENKTLITLFHDYSYISSTIIFTMSIILFLFGHYILQFWLNVTKIDDDLLLITRLLIIGSIFLALQYIPYYLALANGHTKTNVKIGIFTIVLNTPLTIYFTQKYGIIGPGIPWIVVNIIGFVVLSYLIINKFLKNQFYKWLIYDVVVPLLLALFVGIIGYFCAHYVQNLLGVIFVSLFIVGISFSINYIVFKKITKRLNK